MATAYDLTPEDVLSAFQPSRWVKTALTWIRPIVEADVQAFGPSFRDLEGRSLNVAVGRYLCRGVQGEFWTCSRIDDRVAVSEPDVDGFRAYALRNPGPVLCFDVPFCFVLHTGAQAWQSQPDGGVITWNGRLGDALVMHVIKRDIFYATYQEVRS